MNIRHVGFLEQVDPLYWYLVEQIFPQLGVHSQRLGITVFQCLNSPSVYLYEEHHRGIRLVCKFYPSKHGVTAFLSKGEVEYRNLLHLRSLGFDKSPHYVVRPLGFNAAIGNVLAVEFLQGDSLSSVINAAIYQGRGGRLYRKLSALAHFLASVHNRTAGEWTVDFNPCQAYLHRLLGALVEKRGMGREVAEELAGLGQGWRDRSCMWEDRAVMVHGDATPSNFLFGGGRTVLAIDFERMQWTDRAFDLGRICGELAHFFYQGQGHPGGAEPYIGHLLYEYSCHFPDRQAAFAAITRRTPFYMATTLLRIARNSWVDWNYRWRLVELAKTILRGAL